MYRYIIQSLVIWKDAVNRLPLMIRGARQIGKSYAVREFAKNHFENLVEVNFEYQPELKQCFGDLNPVKIINQIELLVSHNIVPGKTLLFLDEIQECPQAILALRYFKEKMPELHVISAGSLLEFVLNDESYSMPVGRVQFMYMRPMSFYEFILALGEDKVAKFLQAVTLQEGISEAVHQKCIRLFREYLIVGGMPEVVQQYVSGKSFLNAQQLQLALLNTFRNDFGKYAKKTEHRYMQAIFQKAPGLVGKPFKYVDIDPDVRSRELKPALQHLIDGGLIEKILSTNASGIPLITTATEKKFKVNFVDVGLMVRASNLSAELLMREDFFAMNRGAIMEQLVGQEFLANANPYEQEQLFYWFRDKKSSLAEVDFIRQVDDEIIPVEVKAGKTGNLKSLKILMEERRLPMGVRVSLAKLELEKNTLMMPAYMMAEFGRLVKNQIISAKSIAR